MRLTTRSNLAMRTLMFCGVNNTSLVRKSDIAVACNVSENHLAQVVNNLAQMGFLDTQRGRTGGMRLGRPMESIKVGEVLRKFESGVPFVECFDEKLNTCPLYAGCRLRGALADAQEAFYAALDSISLADLLRDNTTLEAILRHSGERQSASCMMHA
ncbi:RrF2 family transcriptional regulator [Albirhodobacter sp. R86504]|uniref:RrF2 family transcriptional regulator n=1 Tax=Albirhodobacter sp. R86504 TaxID=3093848 RepID=UPI0036707A7C